MIITLTDYKAYVGINSPNQDVELQVIIDFVNAYIVNYCNTTFSPTIVTLRKITSGNGITLLLPQAPIISVEELRYNTVIVDPVTFILDKEVGIIEAITSFSTNRFAFEIDFTYGYLTAPADLRLSAMEFVTHLVKREFNKSRSLGNGETADYGDPELLPAQVRVGLSMYRVP